MKTIAAFFLCAGLVSAAEFYVAPNGNDADAGTKEKPFATVERARDRARDIPGEAVTVYLRGGTYFIDTTIAFGPSDSGSASSPRIYRSAPGESAVIVGGKTVSGWQPYRNGIYKASLGAQGLGGLVFHQLVMDGKRLMKARYPNIDPAHPLTGGFIYMPRKSPKEREIVTYDSPTLPFAQWGDRSQAELVGYTKGGWTFAITPIKSVDTAAGTITVRAVRVGFSQHDRFYIQNMLALLDTPGEWFHDRANDTLYVYPPDGKRPADDAVIVPIVDDIIALNGRLDSPYEYLDIKNQVSYEENIRTRKSSADDPVSHITFRGLALRCAEQNGLRMTGAVSVNVIGCEVSFIGNYGINLGGVAQPYEEVGNPRRTPNTGKQMGVAGAGQDLLFNDGCRGCRIAGNDVFSTGAEGIMLHGGKNIAENNHVYDCGIFDKDMANINQFGEENIIRRNTIHDSPRSGAFQKGVGNVIELNDISQTQREARDGGGIRMCQRNVRIGGNVIRYNRIVDTIGYGHEDDDPLYYSPYYQWGVYLDDFTAGTTVNGNIIVRASRGGVYVHGGSGNIVSNNIIVDCPYGVEANSMGDNKNFGAERQHNTVIVNNIIAYLGDASYARLSYDDIPAGISASQWYDGLITSCGGNVYGTKNYPLRMKPGTSAVGFDTWRALGYDRDSLAEDPGFLSYERDDFRLKKDSPAFAKGFVPIPYGDIGCYPSDERYRWPLTVSKAPRENPFYPVSVEEIIKARRGLAVSMHGMLREIYESGGVKTFTGGGTAITLFDETMTGKPPVLAFIDKPTEPCDPRLMINFHITKGRPVLSFRLKLDEKKPAPVIIETRQYAGIPAGAKPNYFCGALIEVRADGAVTVGGAGAGMLTPGTWTECALTHDLDRGGEYRFTMNGIAVDVTARCTDARFSSLERILIYNTEKADGSFYIDGLTLTP